MATTIKKLVLALMLITIAGAVVADNSGAKTEEKVYSQKEYDEKLKQELDLMIGKIKKKSIEELTSEVLLKEKNLEIREKDFIKKQEQLDIAETTLTKRINEFELKQKKFLGCIDEKDKNAQVRLTQLVRMISSMKPAKAAEVLAVQEADVSVKILELIDPDKASKIFNLMDKEVSARLQKQYVDMKQ